LVFWRLDQARHAATWDSGEGSYLVGGRWNARGTRVVYAPSIRRRRSWRWPCTRRFKALDTVAHVLTSAQIVDPARVHVVAAGDIPNANWLRPGIPGAGQQVFGDALLRCARLRAAAERRLAS